MTPEQIGRYEILAPLGRGGMGEVFAARLRGESRFQRLYAIKRILPDYASNERAVAMFFDEARTAACIHSPNVVPVLDVGRDEHGAPFMVMELVVGTDLHRFASDERLPVDVAYTLVLDMARGLRDAHATVDPFGKPLDVAHRDISPKNVLVGVDGRARLTDFGLAKARRRTAVSAPGEVKGSYSYFSPEHLAGEADAQSDIFSLGIIAWELFCGQRLFRARTPTATLHRVQVTPIPRLTELEPDLPLDLEAVVGRALFRDRAKRWRNAPELVRALEEVELSPVSPEEIGGRARALAEESISRLRALEHAGISQAKTLLAEVETLPDSLGPDTLVDDDHEVPTRRD